MKIVIRLKRHSNMVRVSVFLITVALIAGMAGCGPTPVQYDLTITSTSGGSVTEPGEGTYPYYEGTEVNLVATAEEGYYFVKWAGDVSTVGNVTSASTNITMNGDYSVTANFAAVYDLTITSTSGGSVTAPGEGTFSYDEGTMVNLIAESNDGYCFIDWTGDVDTIANVYTATTTVFMSGNYSVTANFALAISVWDWYDLDAISDNLDGNYILMNDLDSTSAGYKELAGPAANGGLGWEPIGYYTAGFTGTFDGLGYEIRDLSINHTTSYRVGLFYSVNVGGVIRNVGVVNATVSSGGYGYVGALAGINGGTISNSYAAGTVSGTYAVGGLVGDNPGTVSDSYSTGNVVGYSQIGGLIGQSCGTVSNSYSVGSVTGVAYVGGLVGVSCFHTVTNSFWDTETSGQATSDGGTGKTTAEMQDIATFSGWHIGAVADPGIRNPSYIWNIVDDETYPFLSWEPVS
jgi:hypothetical protein